jgi:hypothetical protein
MAYVQQHGQTATSRRSRTTSHSVLTEAAWHVLSPFFDSRDFNVLLPKRNPSTGEIVRDEAGKPAFHSVPKNKNDHWELAFRRMDVTLDAEGKIIAAGEDDLFDEESIVGLCRFHRVGKGHLDQYLRGERVPESDQPCVLYYRSKADARFRVGYGRSVNSPRLANTVFARLLRVPSGVVQSKNCHAILWGIDIDFKPERYPKDTFNDSSLIRDWLVNNHFPGAYSEPSTKGKGWHIYIKLAYPAGGNHALVLSELIQKLKMFLVFLESERIRLGFTGNVDPAVCGVPSCIQRDAKGCFIGISRSQCIKLPNFVLSAKTFRRLRNVWRFHMSPVFFPTSVEIDGPTVKGSSISTAAASSSGLIDALTPRMGSKNDVREIANIVVGDEDDTTDTLIAEWKRLSVCEWKDVGYGRTVRLKQSRKSEDEIAKARGVEDAVARCRSFYMAMNRLHNRVLRPEEINAFYIESGLNRTQNTERRMDLWESQYRYFLVHFRPTAKRLPPLEGFDAVKNHYVKEIEKKVATEKLVYRKNKGKGKQVMKRVSAEDLAAIHYAIEIITDKCGEAFLGYKEAALIYRRLLSRSASPNKIACIFKALRSSGLLGVKEKGRWGDRRATVYVPLVRIMPPTQG